MWYLSALGIGIVGSLHCVTMCGPLMLALPQEKLSPVRNLSRLLLYQFGRISSYAFLGLLLGGLGWGLALWNAQSILAIVSGVLLLLAALFRIDLGQRFQRMGWLTRWQKLIRSGFARLFQRGGSYAFLGMGALNGLLPCGLVYLAIIGAVNASQPLEGALYMASFGLGTVPLLLAVTLAGTRLVGPLKRRLQSSSTILLAAIGVLLIWRGVHLMLPPDFYLWQDLNFAPACH